MKQPLVLATPLAFLALTLAGCGGGSLGSAPPPVTNQSAGGVWNTQYTQSQGSGAGDTIIASALVAEDGQFFYLLTDQTTGCAVEGFGTLSVLGANVAGTTTNVILQSRSSSTTTCAYSDGSSYGVGTVTGTVSQHNTLTVTVNSTTALGTVLPAEALNWTFSSVYLQGSSLSTVAGTYADGSATLTIDASGNITESDPTTGCTASGAVTITDPTYAAFGVTLAYSNCTGTSTVLNGVTATGIGYYDSTTSPAEAVFGLELVVNGTTLVAIGAIPRTG